MAAIQYYDGDGNPVSLDTLCRKEPEWAANRLREELKRIAELEAELAQYKSVPQSEEIEAWRTNCTVLREDRDRLRADRDRQKNSREHWIEQHGLAEAESDRLRAALAPFAHEDLCRTLGGNAEGDNSPVYGREKAVLRLGDFRKARAALNQDKEPTP